MKSFSKLSQVPQSSFSDFFSKRAVAHGSVLPPSHHDNTNRIFAGSSANIPELTFMKAFTHAQKAVNHSGFPSYGVGAATRDPEWVMVVVPLGAGVV